MSIKPTVCILMSTYNGEKYLREQLDSIFSQEDVFVKLVVRDDGSTDKTIQILKEYPNIEIIEGKNLGCEESFKELLYLPLEADYFAFADQDDVWHPRKLISAINNIIQHKSDLAVCNLMIADAEMNIDRPLFTNIEIERINEKFQKYVIGNLHGCVQVWTQNLHKKIQKYKPCKAFAHDTWVNSIANMLSSTYIDDSCYINYRIHGNNTSGLARNIVQKIRKGFSKYINTNKPSRYELCIELLEGFGSLIDKDNNRYEVIKIISRYKESLKMKFKLLGCDYITKSDFPHRCLYCICILLNKY